ncbi:double-strand-break repair protein rad21 homolog isoform X4 [Gigantopelta aegis]|uniref:double-strand-break repair protein rad21 homolog isoform X4 n=1 Tax=Gigantopelta aegis TaxID=1735272 RepID=UPI001B88CA5C|nr:double-strand-break repair protein rad21 homolog isoform X4 [Gigantopelta aegis]
MFYAHFVLSKKGPLARIWLAAHWDKKLTKAHVFETNIDSSVDAILKPKVKMALRTSGHLLLGVVRIYSRKAKYLLADCNEAFVKIKMAFRPGVVDLPEENREAAVAAITLQENFHDFETTLADLEDIDVQAQFSVNQSRPEEITMREDLGSIAFMGDDGFGAGDIGFDEREILRDASHLDETLYKSHDLSSVPIESRDKTLGNSTSMEKSMDVDLEPPVGEDGFGGTVGDAFMGGEFMDAGGLFSDTPMPEVSMAQEVEEAVAKPAEAKVASDTAEGDSELAPPVLTVSAAGASALSTGEQTTLVPNEEEAFALEPLDVTAVAGTEKKTKRKRKLIVDEQKGIPSETMKLQLSDTSDIVTTLDLAPPTKKLMHWKETGGVEKLFALPGRPIVSKLTSKFFTRNLVTKQLKERMEDYDVDKLDLDAPEVVREEEKLADKTQQSEMSTIIEEPSITQDTTITRSRRSEKSLGKPAKDVPQPETPHVHETSTAEQDLLAQATEGIVDMPSAQAVDSVLQQDQSLVNYDPNMEDGPPSIAPFSVGPASVGPPSVGPPSVAPPTFDDMEEHNENDKMPETVQEEEQRWTKRTAQMQHVFEIAFRQSDSLSFKEMARRHNRKQAASRFYTLLVLKKHQCIVVEQTEPYGDIFIEKGPKFGMVC